MNYLKILIVSLFALIPRDVSAFVHPQRSLATMRKTSTPPIVRKPAVAVTSHYSTTALSMSNTDPDLVVGFVMIAMACTPYILGTVSSSALGLFAPLYNDNEEGKLAEIGWKVRYATLGLALTTLAFVEVYFADNDAAQILRDSYIVWAIFYTEATRKIRSEAMDDILQGDRLFIQLWHVLVVIVLWADVSESYTGQAITNFLKNIFT
mmetsp:Transcript_1057/g.1847  ORF Transcript_1057/g.1847 Transcript_1057/m.1847 type:complete len:208 (+) Transcript_1057:249-872(+)